ncbi:hypothetical protein M0802_000117 [Mischocyttarus mexicanus]|nr:hypothetical protein M0802_000117 [Mischocyttarus mexicanus]
MLTSCAHQSGSYVKHKYPTARPWQVPSGLMLGKGMEKWSVGGWVMGACRRRDGKGRNGKLPQLGPRENSTCRVSTARTRMPWLVLVVTLLHWVSGLVVRYVKEISPIVYVEQERTTRVESWSIMKSAYLGTFDSFPPVPPKRDSKKDR